MVTQNLFEYLARPIPDAPQGNTTELTEADQDEYDAPAGLGTPIVLGPDSVWAETYNTRADGDTHDDDAGLNALGIPRSALETTKTSMTYDTYDNDVGALAVSVPTPTYAETYVTKVENETYDDDPSAEGLSFPVT
jgi:hypothetical protein